MISPPVSIIIPCYQQAGYLREAVESVLRQTRGDWEIIIVNDGSTDETGEVGRALSAAHAEAIQYVEQANRGQAMARQAGLERASGEFLVLLDADDLLEPEMIAACLATFGRRADIDAVVGDAWMIDPAGRRLCVMGQTRLVGWPRILANNPYGALAAIMVRAAVVRAAGGLGTPGTPGTEDWDLWARLARCRRRFITLDGPPVAGYRQTPGGTSRNALKMLRSTIELLDRCATDDPRLATAAAGRPVHRPISRESYETLRNGRVFKAFGLALAGASDAAGDDDADATAGIDAILALLTPGCLNARYCADQFLEGLHYGYRQHGTAGAPARRPLPAAGLGEWLEPALRGKNLARHLPRLLPACESILADPSHKRSLAARLSDRLGDRCGRALDWFFDAF